MQRPTTFKKLAAAICLVGFAVCCLVMGSPNYVAYAGDGGGTEPIECDSCTPQPPAPAPGGDGEETFAIIQVLFSISQVF